MSATRASAARGRPLVRLLVISAFWAGALASCAPGDGPQRSGDPALDADVRVSPTPAVVGESRVFVRAIDGETPLPGARVTVRGGL